MEVGRSKAAGTLCERATSRGYGVSDNLIHAADPTLRCWVCGGPVAEPHTDGDGGPVCCSARCLRECRADMYGEDAGPGDSPESS